MNASEVRQKYLEFMKSKGHVQVAPAPLVLENDPTTLFTGSGMQPLLPYLLGKAHEDGARLTDSQPCLRLQDIEDVGDPRHTTVFEMLGNWSLGDYFKEEQIRNFFTFLTKEVGLNPEKIYVTCFIGNEKYGIPRDDEAAHIWQTVFKEAGIDAKIVEINTAENGDKRGIREGERIFFYNDKENWWSRGGGIETTPIGDPCGPDSEVFYDFGEDKQDVEKYGQSHPASDGARFMEIGNQVFMQYRRKEDGTFEELEHKNVDFGAGLERITAASMDSYDVFQISLLKPIVDRIVELSGKQYADYTSEMRIIADHLRGAYLLTAQGLKPSNKQQGYALRRLIRRAILKALNLGIEDNFLAGILPMIAENYKDLPDSILTNRDEVLDVLNNEEQAFRRTLRRGMKELNRLKDKGLTGKELFMLQDTYGFPLELSVEEAKRQEIELSADWEKEFDAALAEQRNRSQTASKGMFKGGLEDHGEMSTKYHTATHLLLAALQQLISADICQKGSNITAERMRLDFNVDHKLEKEELQKLEDQVNEWIKADLPVVHDEYDKAYARDTLKAHGSFWDKYPEKLTVYTIGDFDNPTSREVCGGPHVEHTGVLGHFVIKKEEASSAGVRRIKAILE
ncbi:MAG: alanine--tRNA ligase-related protein [Candidatus Saccharibacteria bacterium]|nr:alanine--tRNA ligase-related protein [Candidatus Saccharibacteria bacterium]